MSRPELLFLLQNQDKYFLGKNNEWLDGTDTKELFKTPHRDVAVNQLFEVNAQDYRQRIHILDCEVEGRNQPKLDPDLMPPPLPKAKAADDPAEDSKTTCISEQDGGGTSEPKEELLVQEV